MYLYDFAHQNWQDGVLWSPWVDQKYKTWDLLYRNEHYFLVLWDEISFSELYRDVCEESDFKLVEKKFLHKTTMERIHWMVYQRYSNYKSIIKLFLDSDIPALLSKIPKKTKKAQKSELHIGQHHIVAEEGQVLCVFPDLRSIKNTIGLASSALLLSSLDTQSKKNTHRASIRSGAENMIVSTSSEIFQDFNSLQKIYFIEPQKRYYASQQEPRYKVKSVLEKLAEINKAELISIASEDLIS